MHNINKIVRGVIMGKYKIADLNVLIENGGMKTEQRGKIFI
ncbi:MAG: hypothetical protein ACLRPW_08360 [Intestinibacter sp.]